MTKKNRLFSVLCLGVIMTLLQTPFLLSDPDIHITGGRGPNTDEGLNSGQIRNYVNHHDLTLKNSASFIRNPLFGVILFVPFKIFGTQLLTGRLTILLLSLTILLYIFSFDKNYFRYGIYFLVIVFSEYYIFHYFHYCLAEILSTVLIFLAVFITIKSIEKEASDKQRNSNLPSAFLSATFISISYFLKIQFLYVLLILPLSILFYVVFKLSDRAYLFKQLKNTILFLSLYLIAYFLVFYLPNKDLFNKVMLTETSDRFADISYLKGNLKFIIKYIFNNNYLIFFTCSFYILFLAGVIFFFRTQKVRYKLLFIALSCWLLTEMHKLTMLYLPSRYLISLFFVMGLIMALVLYELTILKGKTKLIYAIKLFSIAVLISFGIKNFIDYKASFLRRTYSILEIDNYLSQYKFANQPVMGAWAPSLTWKSKAKTYPIWKDYFNDADVIKNYNPAIIIAEENEADSDSAFASRNINVDAYADSIKYFTVNNWKLKLLWIKKTVVTK